MNEPWTYGPDGREAVPSPPGHGHKAGTGSGVDFVAVDPPTPLDVVQAKLARNADFARWAGEHLLQLTFRNGKYWVHVPQGSFDAAFEPTLQFGGNDRHIF